MTKPYIQFGKNLCVSFCKISPNKDNVDTHISYNNNNTTTSTSCSSNNIDLSMQKHWLEFKKWLNIHNDDNDNDNNNVHVSIHTIENKILPNKYNLILDGANIGIYN